MQQPAHKIAISGAFSTGKTSLVLRAARRLESEGVAVAVIGDVARKAPMPLHREQTPSASAWLIGTQMASESEVQQASVDVVLCDRGILDILSHTLLIEPCSERDRELLARVWEIGIAWAQTYDIVMTTCIDPSEPTRADGLRIADDAYRKRLDDALDTVYNRLGMKRRDLPAGTGPALDAVLTRLRSLR